MKSIYDGLANNTKVRVAIFRGAGGKSFVSGSDIAQFTSFKRAVMMACAMKKALIAISLH